MAAMRKIKADFSGIRIFAEKWCFAACCQICLFVATPVIFGSRGSASPRERQTCRACCAARDPPAKSTHLPTPPVLSSGTAALLRLAPVRLPSWEYPANLAGYESCVRALTHAHSGSFRAQIVLAGCGDCSGWGVFVDFVEFPYRSGCCGPIQREEIPFFRGFACSLANRDEIRIKSDLAGGDLRQRP